MGSNRTTSNGSSGHTGPPGGATRAGSIRARGFGFTLVELMVVVAVIAIVVAVAIPNFVHSKIAANESSAISSLRTISSVIEQYRVRFQRYPVSLGQLSSTGYIDDRLGAGQKSGYAFQFSSTVYTYAVQADPLTSGTTGDRHFYIDDSGVLRWASAAPAGAADPPIDS
ncbi:MAG: prepilin-type N-terminal cleavage/methylation domain-containing protein [Planctomycetes bacterium]|nr:prepilin-type N-terminal cleavage/methylation domain-containing protein [Planctomycetota bacterium]